MRSWSPFATKTGWVMTRQVVGCTESRVPDGLELGDPGLHRDSLVAVVSAFLEAVEVVRCGPFALGGAGEEQEVPRIAAGERRFEVGGADDA